MSISSLCNHRGVLYRPRGPDDLTTRDEFGDVLNLFDVQTTPAGLNCRPNQNWSGDLQDHGPGEQQEAQRQWFLDVGWSPRERDVLSIDSGPEAPVLLRILSVTPCTDPDTVHHYEVNVEVWKGTLTEEVTSS